MGLTLRQATLYIKSHKSPIRWVLDFHPRFIDGETETQREVQ